MAEMGDIILQSLNLVKKHFLLYLVSLVYIFVGSVVFMIAGLFILPFVYAFSIIAAIDSSSMKEGIAAIFSGLIWMFIIGVLLIVGFFSGYIGGLGDMLRGILTRDRLSINDFRMGVFQTGSRIFAGMVVMLILLILPFYWGTGQLMRMYGIYDFATMQSGWNTALRLNMEKSHTWVVLLTYATDLVIVILLWFWWIVAISEGRHFIMSFIRSIRFFFRDPSRSLIVSIGSIAALYLTARIFGAIWGLAKWSPVEGQAFGVFLILPVVILVTLQFYDRSFIKKTEPQPTPFI